MKKTIKDDRQFWDRKIRFQKDVYQRDDLINPSFIDPKTGLSNKELMQKGYAPIGPDGKPVNLHHGLQTDNGAIFEMSHSFHFDNYKVIHINPNTMPSGINRSQFKAWRKNYWQFRSNDF